MRNWLKKLNGAKISALVYAPVFICLFVLVFTLFSLFVFIGVGICIYEDVRRSDFVARLFSEFRR